jgi:hypothetical protein
MAQYIMAGVCVRGVCSPHGGWEAMTDREERVGIPMYLSGLSLMT